MSARTRALLVLLLAAACAPNVRQAAEAEPPLPAGLAAATFDSAWRIIRDTHFDTTFNGVDWAAVRGELRPRAERARSRAELREAIEAMLGRLRQSHFELVPAWAVDAHGDSLVGEIGEAGMSLRLIDGATLVDRVEPGGAAERAGVSAGWEVRRIGSYAVRDSVAAFPRAHARRPSWLTAELLARAALYGPVGSAVRLELVDGAGGTVRRDVTRTRQAGERVKLGNLPLFVARLDHRRLAAPGTPDVGVIRFNFWMVPLVPQFDRALDELRGAGGIVIDLRDNAGGWAATVSGIAGHFFGEPVALGTFTMREGAQRVLVNPRLATDGGRRVRPYAGPVAILTGPLTASASEVFAGGMQATGRARVFGETTFGGVLPATNDRLPTGDVLVHAIADFVTARGERLEGRGVVPDERVVPTRAALLAGRDPALDAAVRWIASRPRAGTP